MKTQFSDVTKWFASANAVSFALFVGVCFLFTNYQGVIFGVTPENIKEAFVYPFWLRVIIAHLDSFFFAFATVVIIFQSKNEWQKGLYCFFEITMLCLNLTKQYHENNNYYIAIYVGVFSGVTLYFLGKLAKEHLNIETKEMQKIAELENELQAQTEAHRQALLQASETHSKEAQSIAKTLQETKEAMQALETKHSELQDAMRKESEAKEFAMQQNTAIQSELQALQSSIWQWEVSHLKLTVTSNKKASNWRQDNERIKTLAYCAERLQEIISLHDTNDRELVEYTKQLESELQALKQPENERIETN